MLARTDVDCQLSRATIFNASPQSCSPCSHLIETFQPYPTLLLPFLVDSRTIAHSLQSIAFFGIHPLTRRVVVLSFELIRKSSYNI